MSEGRSRFQQMNGCAACRHVKEADPDGRSPAASGKSYWCSRFGKAVDARDGAACDGWELAG